jgi:hypothetical protein
MRGHQYTMPVLGGRLAAHLGAGRVEVGDAMPAPLARALSAALGKTGPEAAAAR